MALEIQAFQVKGIRVMAIDFCEVSQTPSISTTLNFRS